jgi:hypothetical protein
VSDDVELERLERLKDSVADGTYFVASEKLATKLIDNMLKLGYLDRGLDAVNVPHAASFMGCFIVDDEMDGS